MAMSLPDALSTQAPSISIWERLPAAAASPLLTATAMMLLR